jgi:hypothetical protein
MSLNIRTALTADGDIEAAHVVDGVIRRVVIDRRMGTLMGGNVASTADDFRPLIRAARVHVVG